MLEYFAYKKYKAKKAKKEAEGIVPAINDQDEKFLEAELAPQRKRWSFFVRKPATEAGPSQPGPSEVKDTETTETKPDEAQKTQLESFLGAFNMNLDSSWRDRFSVYTMNTQTKELMTDFMQILKDTQNGVPIAFHDLEAFFIKYSKDLKQANDSTPAFVRALVLKLLPISTIPSFADLKKPGALMALIRSVLVSLKTKFPAYVGTSALMVLSVLIVILGLYYAFKRGRDEREQAELEELLKSTSPADATAAADQTTSVEADKIKST